MRAALARPAPPPAAAVDLTIAGVRLAFRAPAGLTLEAPGFEYRPFLAASEAAQCIGVALERGPPPAVPGDARLLFDTGDGWQLLARRAERWLRMPRRDGGGSTPAVLWQLSWTAPLRDARLWVAPQQVRDGTLRHVIQYPLDQILVTDALLARRGLLLHAAGVAGPRGGIALAGVSGAGKSTVTRLLQSAGGLAWLSDDRVVAAATRDGFDLHGTPWAGDARVAVARRVPLAAIGFLRQSATPALTRLAPADALRRLLPVATLPWFDGARIGAALDAAAALVAGVPCFELAFTRDARATHDLIAALPDAP